MRYYLHIPLPENLKRTISEITQKYQSVSRSEPHITLIEPRKLLPGQNYQGLVKRIKDVCAGIKPLKIETVNVGFFNKKEVIYLEVVRSMELAWYRRSLVTIVKDVLEEPENDFGFNPHITIALATKFKPDVNKNDVWEKLKNINLKTSFDCTKIFLLGRENEATWQTLNQFTLNG